MKLLQGSSETIGRYNRCRYGQCDFSVIGFQSRLGRKLVVELDAMGLKSNFSTDIATTLLLVLLLPEASTTGDNQVP